MRDTTIKRNITLDSSIIPDSFPRLRYEQNSYGQWHPCTTECTLVGSSKLRDDFHLQNIYTELGFPSTTTTRVFQHIHSYSNPHLYKFQS